MKLLGRKKKEEEEEDEEEEEKPKKKKRKPRRKKKTPPKPWGRKERVMVALLLTGTILVSALLSIRARSWKLPGLPRLKVSSVRIPFLTKEKIVIEGDNSDSIEFEDIVQGFSDRTNDLSGVYGFYVIRLNSGASYGLEEDSTFQAASLIKLPVMVGMYKEEEDGNLDLDEEYELKNEDKSRGSGSLANEDQGYILTYREMISRMGKESDNTAYRIALKKLGEQKVSEIINELGMRDTDLEENETTPEDMGKLLRKLWSGEILRKENREELLSFLTNTIYEDHLAAGIPNGVEISHKYGRETNVVNDAGIIYSDSPYVLVIMSQGVIVDEADKVFPELSSFIYDKETLSDN